MRLNFSNASIEMINEGIFRLGRAMKEELVQVPLARHGCAYCFHAGAPKGARLPCPPDCGTNPASSSGATPAVRGKGTDVDASAPHKHQLAQLPDGASPCVMVVDDEPDFCSVVSELLGISDVTVHQAHNAAQAMSLLEDATPDFDSDRCHDAGDGWIDLRAARPVRPLPALDPHDRGERPCPSRGPGSCPAGGRRRLPPQTLHLAPIAADNRSLPAALPAPSNSRGVGEADRPGERSGEPRDGRELDTTSSSCPQAKSVWLF